MLRLVRRGRESIGEQRRGLAQQCLDMMTKIRFARYDASPRVKRGHPFGHIARHRPTGKEEGPAVPGKYPGGLHACDDMIGAVPMRY
jgi:hypothetical protein